MTAAGWHPDPHGRADRRYHDGSRWTEHVADADGATSVDPPDPDPAFAAGPVIGAPPPRQTGDPPAPAPPVEHTQPLPPDAVARAARPMEADHTAVMSAEDVAAAAALAASRPPPDPDSTDHTAPIDPAAVAAVRESLADRDDRGPAAPATTGRRRSLVGIGLALVGTAVALVGLLVLPWITGPGPDVSYLDIRDVVDRTGPDLGGPVSAFVLTGALLAVAGGGLAALARAIGAAGLRVAAAAVVVLGVAGLAVLGFAVTDVDGGDLAGVDAGEVGPDAGTPVTLPDGSPVTDPTSGAPVTGTEAGMAAEDMSDGQLTGAAVRIGEQRLEDAAVVGAIALAALGALLVLGLVLKGVAGHVVTAVGLVGLAVWAGLAATGLGDLPTAETGLGPWAVAVGALLLAAGAAVPGPRRADDPA